VQRHTQWPNGFVSAQWSVPRLVFLSADFENARHSISPLAVAMITVTGVVLGGVCAQRSIDGKACVLL
jgi:hypothetical protein